MRTRIATVNFAQPSPNTFLVSPLLAWAWLHTLRTGETTSDARVLEEWAMAEKMRYKRRPVPFKPRLVPKLRSHRIQQENDASAKTKSPDGKTVA